MIRTEKRLRVCCTLLVMNLAFIWGNSMLPGEVSGAISEAVKAILIPIWELLFPGSGAPSGGGGLLRKVAHFSEFCALGMCLTWLMGMLGKPAVFSAVCGFAAACVDETIQSFVPDRNPSPMDVAIDTSGVITGILLLLLGHYVIRKKKTKQYMEENES